MSHTIDHQQDALIKRLNRIEGQIKGIKKMVLEEKETAAIMIQLNAARAALQKISQILLEAQADHSLMHVNEGADLTAEMENLRRVITQYNKLN
ncbi:metal-sensitive transcriptional regulator [Enterococcus sp.]|uniref:metal-sensitive transcriptional regulator n=1 Tax=Enterococcus sp. TaxID=35783 RepID=UPI0028A6E8C3|nr:metal-sensitive transcriptional regulator [Enterococcus sp.]